MKIKLIFVIILALAVNAYAAGDKFRATCLTGGTSGCLDAIDITNDGIGNGEKACVDTTTNHYEYTYNSSSGAAESSPDVIAPDNDGGAGYGGDGRWILIGVYGATFQSASGTSINEFSTDGTMAGNSDDAAPTEQAVVEYIPLVYPGFVQRAQVTYSDTDTITLTPAVYYHSGTLEQAVYWDSTLTFDFGSGGSNAASDDLGASEYHYLYIDDSALSGSTITAARLLNDTTAPSWADAKHGFYNGDDMCIGAFLTNGSSEIIEFFQNGNFILFADQITDRSQADLDNTWTDVTLSIPAFSQRAEILSTTAYSDGNSALYWRTNGQTGSTGHIVGYASSASVVSYNTFSVITDSSQIIEIKHGTSNANATGILTDGFYLPNGM